MTLYRLLGLHDKCQMTQTVNVAPDCVVSSISKADDISVLIQLLTSEVTAEHDALRFLLLLHCVSKKGPRHYRL